MGREEGEGGGWRDRMGGGEVSVGGVNVEGQGILIFSLCGLCKRASTNPTPKQF